MTKNADNNLRRIFKMKLSDSLTLTNLAIAFADKCQDNAKYLFLMQQARDEGYLNVASVCEQHAKEQLAHAKIFFDFLTDDGKDCLPDVEIRAGFPFKSGTLPQVIKMTAGDHLSRATVIYPNFAQIAKEEGFADVSKKFKLIAEIDRRHYLVLEQLYAKIEKSALYDGPKDTVWQCSVCGHTDTGQTAWQTCPVCNAPQGNVTIPIEF